MVSRSSVGTCFTFASILGMGGAGVSRHAAVIKLAMAFGGRRERPSVA